MHTHYSSKARRSLSRPHVRVPRPALHHARRRVGPALSGRRHRAVRHRTARGTRLQPRTLQPPARASLIAARSTIHDMRGEPTSHRHVLAAEGSDGCAVLGDHQNSHYERGCSRRHVAERLGKIPKGTRHAERARRFELSGKSGAIAANFPMELGRQLVAQDHQ